MQMWTDVVARPAGVADFADLLSVRHPVAFGHRAYAQVGVVALPAAAVIDDDEVAEPVGRALMRGGHHGAGCRRDNRVAKVRAGRAAPVPVDLPGGTVGAAVGVVAGPALSTTERHLESRTRSPHLEVHRRRRCRAQLHRLQSDHAVVAGAAVIQQKNGALRGAASTEEVLVDDAVAGPAHGLWPVRVTAARAVGQRGEGARAATENIVIDCSADPGYPLGTGVLPERVFRPAARKAG